MKRLPIFNIVAAGLLAFVLLSCQTPPATTAYKSIAATEATVDKAMTAWGEWVVKERAAGLDTSPAEAKVRLAYGNYRAVMNAATAAWAVYQADKNAGTTEAQAKLNAAIAACTELSNLINIWTAQ